MAERKQCEFQLIRYVPDTVKNEFVNIGVVMRARLPGSRSTPSGSLESAPSPGESPAESAGEVTVRFTRDWSRVRCIDPDADIAMLEALEAEVARRILNGGMAGAEEGRPVLELLEDSLSNAVQITPAKAFLAESFVAGLEQLVSLYVEPAKRERSPRRSGRAAIQTAMRAEFERAGVWALMRKQIAAAAYTRPGDPLRIDCGYRPNGVVRMFQAVSLESDLQAAKVLAFSARALHEGVARVEQAKLELTAIVEPLRASSSRASAKRASSNRDVASAAKAGAAPEASAAAPGEAEDEDRLAQYRFAIETMEENRIRVMTIPDLPRMAETARLELGV